MSYDIFVQDIPRDAKSLEDVSFLLSNDSVSVVMETDEDE